jgi:dienelactone hydrolase
MHTLRFTSHTHSDGVLERDFVVGDIPGVLWSPPGGPDHAPVVLMGHGGGLHKKAPAQVARARDEVISRGLTVVAIDAPGHGERPRTAEDDEAQAGIRNSAITGDTDRFRTISIEYALSLTRRAVPEWQCVLDALQALPEIGTEAPIGYGGGVSMGTAIGIPLTAVEPRITAAVFGGGFFVYDQLLAAARQIMVPVQFLLPWDDEYVDRQSSLALFDAFGSTEKTLHANPGDHRRIRWYSLDQEFLSRHLYARVVV